MSTVAVTKAKEILRSEILVLPPDNYRTDLPAVEEMAQLLTKSGQLQEVGVTELDPPAPTGEKYRLTFGYRRMAGWDLLGWKDSRPIRAAVKIYPKGDPTKAILDNYHANHHVPVHPYDIARLIVMLEDGAEAGKNSIGEDIMARTPMSPDEVQQEMCISKDVYRKHRTLERGTDPAVKDAARKAGAPLRVLYQIACLKGEGDTDDEKRASRRERQEARLNQWIAKKAKLKAASRQREKASGPEPEWTTNDDLNDDLPGMSDAADAKKEKPILSPKRELDPKGRTVELHMAALMHKRECMKPRTAEEKQSAAFVEGALAVLAFLTGAEKALPKGLIKEADFDALHKAVAKPNGKSNGAVHA